MMDFVPRDTAVEVFAVQWFQQQEVGQVLSDGTLDVVDCICWRFRGFPLVKNNQRHVHYLASEVFCFRLPTLSTQ